MFDSIRSSTCLAHVVCLHEILADDAVQLVGRIQGRLDLRSVHLYISTPIIHVLLFGFALFIHLYPDRRSIVRHIEIANDASRDVERVLVVDGVVIGDAAHLAVEIGAAEILGGHGLARGGLDQRRTAEENGALTPHDHVLVAHGGHVGAARRAAAHDDGDLGDALRGHVRLVEEDAAEVVAIRKHFRLVGQVGTAAVNYTSAKII